MTRYRFFALYNDVWTKLEGVYAEDYIHCSQGSFLFKRTKGRKIVSKTLSTKI